jgi:hypothetical protein
MILRAARRADHKLESLFVGCIQISAYRRGFFYGCKFLFSRVLKIIVKNNRFFFGWCLCSPEKGLTFALPIRGKGSTNECYRTF